MSVPMWLDPETERQQTADTFYWSHGPCCAGCDWWANINGLAGECRRSAPVSAKERHAMLSMSGCSLPLQAGHILTLRDHHCGDFKDEFDWSSLPKHYLRRIGAQPSPPHTGATT